MPARLLRTCLATCILLAIAGSASRAAAADDPTLVLQSHGIVDPHTDGVYAVWTEITDVDTAPPTYTIFAARLDDGQRFQVSDGPASLLGGDVSAGVAVWSADGDIFGMTLATRERFTVADSALDESNPAISGSKVVWVETDGVTQRLMARDIATPAFAPLTVASLQGKQFGAPQIDGAQVLWAELWPEDQNGEIVYMSRRLLTVAIGDSASPTRLDDGQQFRNYTISGGVVVYNGYGAPDLGVIELASGQRRDIQLPNEPATGWQFASVATNGRYIVGYHDIPSEGGAWVSQLLGYDLITESAFVAVDSGINYFPDLASDTVVWYRAEGAYGGGTSLHEAQVADLLPSARHSAHLITMPLERYFPVTGHSVMDQFIAVWDANGALPVFGYPLTEAFQERNADTGNFATSQYFERERFEAHPEYAGTPYEVELGRLGAELLASQGRDWMSFPKAAPAAPHYVSQTGHAVAPEFWDYWSSHGLELGDTGVSYRESLALFGYPLSEPMIETNADGDTVLTQYFERAVFEYHLENSGTPYAVLLRRLGAETLAARGW